MGGVAHLRAGAAEHEFDGLVQGPLLAGEHRLVSLTPHDQAFKRLAEEVLVAELGISSMSFDRTGSSRRGAGPHSSFWYSAPVIGW